MSVVKEYYMNKAQEWAKINKDKREESAKNIWYNLTLTEREELLTYAGYKTKYASYTFSSLTAELHEMIKFVFITEK